MPNSAGPDASSSMAHSEINDLQLVLVSARKSRGTDHWDKDDYDVRPGDANGPVVGRIMRHPQAHKDQPWFWTITARDQPPSVYNHGYAASREQAIRYFKARLIAR
jgi:hypothetical protein